MYLYVFFKIQVPPPLDEFVEFTPSMQNYKPILYLNDYWNLNKEYQPINETVKVLNLTLTFQPLSLFKWQMYSAQQMKNRYVKYFKVEVFESDVPAIVFFCAKL